MGMNEKEAIKKVRDFGLYHALDDLPYSAHTAEAFAMAIDALEEIQQYRAIGTIEEIKSNMAELKRWHSNKLNDKIKNPFANTSTLICANCNHKDEYIEELELEVEEYREIGTVDDCMVYQNVVEKYKKIGTPDECRAAVEKQRAKKDNHSNGDFVCTVCKPIVGKFCHHCGNLCFFGR